MILPVLQDEAFLSDVREANSRPDELHVWWLGQSGFLVQWQGRHLLFDPYLSDSLTEKYAATDKPHTRMTELIIAPEKLDFIDVATSTHNHTDHLDAETLGPLFAVNPGLLLVAPAANRAFIADRLGRPLDDPAIIDLDDGVTAELGEFHFTGLPAAHETLDCDEQGRHRYLGFFVRVGPFTLYHAGDTLEYPDLAERLLAAKVDLAFLPINGRAPERRVTGNMDGPEAARLASAAKIGCVIPCHYEMFEFNTEPPERFVAECEKLGQRHQVLRAGERFSMTS